MSVSIRNATPADVPEIIRMIRELAEFEKLDHLMMAREDDLTGELFSERPKCESLVAELSTGRIAGYAIFFHNFSTFLCRPGIYLEDLYVRPDFRRQGLGRMFLQSLAKIARDRRCARFEWTVLDWNQDAIDFYESLGAEILPDWRVVRLDEPGISRLAG